MDRKDYAFSGCYYVNEKASVQISHVSTIFSSPEILFTLSLCHCSKNRLLIAPSFRPILYVDAKLPPK